MPEPDRRDGVGRCVRAPHRPRVGLEIHEAPRVSGQVDATLTAGHVVTVEPGDDLPGIGDVRVEDMVVVTPADRCEPLTLTPKTPTP